MFPSCLKGKNEADIRTSANASNVYFIIPHFAF